MQVIPATSVRRGFGQTGGATRGGPRRSRCSSRSAPSSSTRPGRRSRTRTTPSARTSRRSTRRSSSAPRRTRWFGPKPGWWPASLPFSPALLILPFPGPLPLHLLLLPRRLLQVVLGRSAGLRRRRAAEELPGRALVPADPAERASLLHVGRAGVHRVPAAWDVWKALWFTDPATGADDVRHRRRHAGARGQRRAARLLHLGLPRAAPRRRRPAGRGVEVAGLRLRVRVRRAA